MIWAVSPDPGPLVSYYLRAVRDRLFHVEWNNGAVLVTVSSSRRRAPTRRPHRYKPIKLGKFRVIVRSSLIAFLFIVGLFVWAVVARRLAPIANTTAAHFDAIVVLGSPADPDGNPTPEQIARVSEAVREYDRGIAPRLIFTGGPAHNRYVESEVMAQVAAAQGIPPSAIFVERRANDTIQNACYSAQIMQEHGWRSAEIVSAPDHLPRAGLIFSHTTLVWRMHAAPPLQPGENNSAGNSALEVLKTVRYLLYANWAERCEG